MCGFVLVLAHSPGLTAFLVTSLVLAMVSAQLGFGKRRLSAAANAAAADAVAAAAAAAGSKCILDLYAPIGGACTT